MKPPPFRWVAGYHREFDLTVLGRYTDFEHAEEEYRAALAEAQRVGVWPENYRSEILDAADPDAAIGLFGPRLVPVGATVVVICADCGGDVDPLGVEPEQHRKLPPSYTRPRARQDLDRMVRRPSRRPR